MATRSVSYNPASMKPSPVSIARPSRGTACGLAFVFAAACFLGGCAAESPPTPPRIETPARITDLKIVQVGHTLVLTFTEPTRTTDGRRLTKPIGVDLFRNAGPAPPASPDVMTTQKPWVVISPRDLARFNHDGKIRFSHTFSPAEFARSAGSVHTFAALTLTRGFRGRPRKSSLSNSAQIEILNLPPPVDNLQATET
ncbi:MAG: hypothetical protein KGM47_02225, partial [Acidobacteriota bacterium]|nr:hypothetical protein [Acidobacteriota bacterium]